MHLACSAFSIQLSRRSATFATVAASAAAAVLYRNRAIAFHAQNGDVISALRVFNYIPSPTIVSWNSLLAAFSKSPGKLKDALNLFDKIPQPDVISFNTLLSCHLINSDLLGARQLFSSMVVKDVTSWNIMVSGLARHGLIDEAREHFLFMPEKNSVSWNAIVSAFIQAGDLYSAGEYFSQAPNKNDIVLRTSMIAGFMSVGKIERAWEYFYTMHARNSVTWNAMIAGLVDNGQYEEGLKLFRRMIAAQEVHPNPSTLSSSLLACSNLSALESGRQIHQWVSKLPISMIQCVGTSLLSMYCKCGDLASACKLFEDMPVKDIITWNAMISGYAQHGHGERAIQLFGRMKDGALKPNRITFVTLLLACIHSGLVDIGMRYFESMEEDYGVRPSADHYTCMVNLLCRAGLLKKAVHLIHSMPFEPHPATFGTLLNSSRIHKNSLFAEFAARRLVELEPQNAGAYVQLANVYASMNRWDDVAKVRKRMKENQAVKMPGYSWIEVGGAVHEFRSGDRLHPHLEMIHEKLNELWTRIKDAGYVPDLEFALHDVGDEQREMILMKHGEKLAIAFALISTTPGTPLRIFKNLRVCGDCHHAIKYISIIEQREIILRDNTRFHHFTNGKCTCGDYW
ncbi:pentatricopeptide repeat-containing protein At4g16835, mitochondrial-like [Phalaenopsis equestris]|uniref:pentatricopeptide repeat-containing protein At4g16835, mitochondrial-like n=1 Tax=Phalaenopsis equestris TaxID=78828 RepID=UPI0009E454E1|nr:pentatricopeptide repeat-containing protein At4g16835, mitochondrial-like [Phalaenopsis equestris]